MIPGIVAGQMRAAAGGGLWTPLNMAAVPQIYLDAQDSVVTDVSGFASAISNLGAMGSTGDFTQSTAANRPAILAAELNGQRALSFDGTADHMIGSTADHKAIFRDAPAAWVFAVCKKRTADGSDTTRVLFTSAQGVSTGTRFSTLLGSTISGASNNPVVQGRRVDGGTFASGVSSVESSGGYMMLFTAVDFTNQNALIIIDATQVFENLDFLDTAGNTSDTASFSSNGLGATSSGAAPADMDLACMIISHEYPSIDDIDKLNGWAAHKYGLTANLPGGHPYKTVAPTV